LGHYRYFLVADIEAIIEGSLAPKSE